ncbi:MAG TPA: hypothetical protein VM432_08030 [Bdellovibrionales bacterium]|jgi:hypothetical protein|nr:hypothetical protein [Bdellovibrionales bacterium]
MAQRPSNPNNLPDPDETKHPERKEPPPKSRDEDRPLKDPNETEPGRESPTDIDIERKGELRLDD